VALRSDIPEVVDHLCVILEKLSKIRYSCIYFIFFGADFFLSSTPVNERKRDSYLAIYVYYLISFFILIIAATIYLKNN
jgi:hypothetical protein